MYKLGGKMNRDKVYTSTFYLELVGLEPMEQGVDTCHAQDTEVNGLILMFINVT